MFAKCVVNTHDARGSLWVPELLREVPEPLSAISILFPKPPFCVVLNSLNENWGGEIKVKQAQIELSYGKQ